MFKSLRADIAMVRKHDPASPSTIQIFFLYQGIHALIFHRLCHSLYIHNFRFLARWIALFARFCTTIEIHPAAKIAPGVFIDHGAGIVIGETAVVGKGCILFHGSTLGGTGNEKGKRHPTLAENVIVGAGAKILGNISIGSNSRIAGNAVVLKNVPENATVVGIPGKVVRINGEKVAENCNVNDLLASLQSDIEELKNHVAVLESTMHSLKSHV